MPRYGPGVRAQPRNLQQALTENGADVVSGFRARGYRGIVLTQAVHRVFPNLRSQSVTALIGYERREVAAAKQAQATEATRPIARPAGVANADIAAKIRYGIITTVKTSGGETLKSFGYVSSNIPLSRQQLEQMVGERIAAGRAFVRGRSPNVLEQEAEITSVEVLKVERGAG